MKKYVQRMWRIHEDAVFDLNGEIMEFFFSWVFRDEKEAQRVDEFNNC